MIDSIRFAPAKPVVPTGANPGNTLGAAELAKSFGSFLNEAIENLNKQQAEVNALNQSFVIGEAVDVHQLTIAAEKAYLSLELAVQVRNKAIEAYQEIMRMQI